MIFFVKQTILLDHPFKFKFELTLEHNIGKKKKYPSQYINWLIVFYIIKSQGCLKVLASHTLNATP